jgi:hypothetical protein
VKKRAEGAPLVATSEGGDPIVSAPSSKVELERRMEGARESIALTVEEIKDRVEGQYETVKATVEGVLDWREQLQRDPILWSVGALSAGFALGYTFGYAHNRANAPKRSSAMTVFTDTLVAQLGALGGTLPREALDPSVSKLLGFDISQVLQEISNGHAERRTKTKTAPRPRRKAKTRRPR